jgi:hypothetical protein
MTPCSFGWKATDWSGALTTGRCRRFRAFGEELSISRDTVHGRAILERKTMHVEDIAAEIETEFPDSRALQQHNRARTLLATPLLREGAPIGALVDSPHRSATVHRETDQAS